MKVAFVSNFLNHHQIPFCDKMSSLCDEFYFIQTESVNKERLEMGYEEFQNKYSYLVCSYISDKEMQRAKDIIDNIDFVIFGSAPDSLIANRLKKNLPIIRYSEPFLREQIWRQFTPKSLMYKFKSHTRYMFKKVFMLCNGCYTASDYAAFLSYIGKTYKWGYFPKMYKYDIDNLLQQKQKDYVQIIWVGRFLELKHPEMILNTAKSLKHDGYNFKVKIIGSGDREDYMKTFVSHNNLNDNVEFLGNMSPDMVRKHMENSDIFMFNSDHREGWGAVVNEAMNSGCATVVSQGPGCTGFMIKHMENGLVYDMNSFDSLYKNIVKLMDDKTLREKLGRNAYKTILKTWNAETAAENLYKLLENLFYGEKHELYGPCSKAKITPRHGMYKKLVGNIK